MITGIDHVQISIPTGRLPEALAFYEVALGFTRIAKPAMLRSAASGAWLTTESGVNLHLSEVEPFVTDGTAHPAFRVTDALALLAALTAAGYRTRLDAGPPGFVRGSAFDRFGNRVELMQRIDPD